MAAITGKSAIIAYEQTTSTWGTAVDAGAGDEVKVESMSPLIDPRDVIPDPSAGDTWHARIENGRKNVAPELVIPLRWSGRLYSFIAQLMGLDTKTGSSDPYTHTISLVDAIDGSDNFGSLAGQLGPAAGELLFQWPTVKPVGFTIEGPDGSGYMKLTVRTIADSLLLGTDSGMNATDFDSVTHLTLDSVVPPIIPFGNLRFRINAQGGAALAAGDNTRIKRFSLTFNRGFDREWVTRGAAANEWETHEPIENGVPEQTLQIELGDLGALTWLEAFQDETEYKAEAYFAYDADHDLKIEFPRLRLSVPDVGISGVNRIPQTLTFMPMLAAAAPTGMTCTNWDLILRDEHGTAYE